MEHCPVVCCALLVVQTNVLAVVASMVCVLPSAVRHVFHPPQVLLLCFSCTEIQDSAHQKLCWMGSENVSGGCCLVRFPPPIRFAPPPPYHGPTCALVRGDHPNFPRIGAENWLPTNSESRSESCSENRVSYHVGRACKECPGTRRVAPRMASLLPELFFQIWGGSQDSDTVLRSLDMYPCMANHFRDGKTTIKITFCTLRGLGMGAERKIVQKRCFFLGNAMTNQILEVQY